MDTKPSPLNAILWSSLIETDKGFELPITRSLTNKRSYTQKCFKKPSFARTLFRAKSHKTINRYFCRLVQNRRKKWEITFLGFKIWPNGNGY